MFTNLAGEMSSKQAQKLFDSNYMKHDKLTLKMQKNQKFEAKQVVYYPKMHKYVQIKSITSNLTLN